MNFRQADARTGLSKFSKMLLASIQLHVKSFGIFFIAKLHC